MGVGADAVQRLERTWLGRRFYHVLGGSDLLHRCPLAKMERSLANACGDDDWIASLGRKTFDRWLIARDSTVGQQGEIDQDRPINVVDDVGVGCHRCKLEGCRG